MMSDKLIGKKTTIVDQSAFRDLNRNQETGEFIAQSQYRSNMFLQFPGTDTVRVGLGKYWDYQLKETGEGEFKNDHLAASIFCGAPLQLRYCEEEPIDIPADDLSSGMEGLRQRLVLSCRPSNEQVSSNFKFVYPNDNTFDILNPGDQNNPGIQNFFWSYLSFNN